MGKLGVQAACFVDLVHDNRVTWAVSRSECSGICSMSFDRIAWLLGIGREGFNRLLRNGGFTLGAAWVNENSG